MMKKFTLLVTLFAIFGILCSFNAQSQALSGSYTIDPNGSGSTNYTSFAAAVADLSSKGVSAPVTFSVAAGTYTERVYMYAISGASATNTITFDGGNKSLVNLEFTGTSTSNRATVALNGADYITFKNIHIESKNSSYAIAVWMGSAADHNTFENCDLVVPSISSSNVICVCISGSESSYSSGGNNGNYNMFKNNYMYGGYFNVVTYGSSTSTRIKSNEFVGNDITGYYQYAMYLYYTEGYNIQYNHIYGGTNSSNYGIMYYYSVGGNIDANRFEVGYYGLYVYYTNYYSSSSETFFTNNTFSNFTYSYNRAFYIYRAYNFRIFHNSFFCNGTTNSASNAAIYLYYAYSGIIKNNLFSCRNYSMFISNYYPQQTNGIVIDYNDYYKPDGGNWFYTNNNGYYSSLSAWQSAALYRMQWPHDQGSVSTDPGFTDNTDLHIIPPSGGVVTCPALAGVPDLAHDIDGDTRATSGTVMMGADVVPPYDLDIISVTPNVALLGNNTVSVTVKNKGLNAISAQTVTVQYKVDNGSWVTGNLVLSSALAPGGEKKFNFPTKWNITVDKVYDLYVRIYPQIANDADVSDEIYKQVAIGLAGTYYIDINGNGNYIDFNAAVDDLKIRGVASDVTFLVQPGVYNGRVVVPEVTGATSSTGANNIIFDGIDKDLVTLRFNPTSGSEYACLVLNGADYTTFTNITIENLGTSGSQGVFVTNSANYNTISNCDIKVSTTSTSSYAIGIHGGSVETGGYGAFGQYNNFENNNITGGYYGACFRGVGSTALELRNKFIGNHFTNFYYYGMYLYYLGESKIQYNVIENPRYASAYGIMDYYGRGDTVDGNIIHPGQYGLYFYRQNYYYADGTYQSYVANNVINNFLNPTYNIGIYAYYDYYTKFYNNAVQVDGSYSSYSYAALYAYYPYYCDFKNNVFISTGYNYVITLYYPYYSQCDYNNYIYKNSNTFWYPNTTHSNFTSFKNYTNTSYLGVHDQNSFDQMDPHFVSTTDFHLEPGYLGVVGEYHPYPTHDVDGDLRCMMQTYIGPDEPYHKAQTIDFIASDTMCYFTPVTFYNTGLEDEPHNAKWYVNDAYQSSNFHFMHSFMNQGYDTVTLIMQTCLAYDTVVKNIFIANPVDDPISEFMADNNVVEAGEDVKLIDLTDNCPTNWSWEIMPDQMWDDVAQAFMPSYSYLNNTDSNSQNPEIEFYYAGEYDVSLATKNGIGWSNREVKADYINVKFTDVMCNGQGISRKPFGNLYDDGFDQNHGTNLSCNYLIMACAKEVEINFLEFNLGEDAYLRLYDGSSNEGTPLWSTKKYGQKGLTGKMTDARFVPQLIAKSSGMVYIEFESGDNDASGFKLEWAGVGTGAFYPPIASFECEDTGCIVNAFFLENTSVANYKNTRFVWDYDGNGVGDEVAVDGYFNTSFPGLSAIYVTQLIAENCGGVDTFSKQVLLINPQSNPTNGSFTADVTTPVVNQDAVTLFPKADRLSCVNTFKWSITPSSYHFVDPTDMYSKNPRIVFEDTKSYSVTVEMGNSNSPSLHSTVTMPNYITPIDYCTPVVLNLHSDVGISRVKLGEIDNSSAIGEKGYTNYSNDYAATLVLNQSFDITLERNTTFNSMDRKVWIDYNGDGVFDDASELATSELNATTQKWTGSFTVPSSANLGGTKMRVGGLYAGHNSKACGPAIFGEYEDYRIFISNDNIPPVITLVGNDTIYLEKGYTYVEEGAVAIDNLEGNISSRIDIVSGVNNMALGNYFVYYDVADNLGNQAVTVKRTVIVTKDMTPPDLNVAPTGYVNVNTPFSDTSYSAYDLVDGNITSKVKITGYINTSVLDTFELTYSVTDNAGLTTTKTKTVYVQDIAAPDIMLNGDALMYVEISTPFIDPGVTYSDNYWPNNRITYRKIGLVDTMKIGSYVISYEVTDASGNGPATVQRTVIVWDSTAPNITLKGYDEIIVEVHTPFVDPGVNIVDNSNSGFNVYSSGTYYKYFSGMGSPDSIGLFSIFYYVEDAAGNRSDMIARVVSVVDIRCPELKLKGDAYVALPKWEPFTDPGYTVTDNYYDVNDITVDMKSDVNIHVPGLYTVVYTATDPSNTDCGSVVRLVKVLENNTSIEDGQEGIVKVYPNPTNGKFIIDVNMPTNDEISISVINLLGEQIVEVNRGMLNASQFEVDMTDYSAGVYLVKVQTKNNTILERVVLSK